MNQCKKCRKSYRYKGEYCSTRCEFSIQGKRAVYNNRQVLDSKEWSIYWRIKHKEIPELPAYSSIYRKCDKLFKNQRFHSNKNII